MTEAERRRKYRENRTPAQREAERAYHRAYAKKRREEDRERHNWLRREWNRKNPRKIKSIQFKTQFGITLDQYEKLLRRQKGVCAICGCEAVGSPRRGGEKRRGGSVDHDHKTGQVRGILCGLCNLMLGHAKDRPDVLRAAADYLDKSAEPTYDEKGDLIPWSPV